MKSDNEIISNCGDDAAKWAKAFCKTMREAGIYIDEGMMIGWFANAIESRPKAPRLTASEALFGFAGWLTSRADAVTMSSKHDASVVANLVGLFCDTNDLPPPRDGWTTRFIHPS